jgi:hypothetical protein
MKRFARWILRDELNKYEQDVRKAYDVGLSHGFSQGKYYEAHKSDGVILGRLRRELEGILEDKRI